MVEEADASKVEQWPRDALGRDRDVERCSGGLAASEIDNIRKDLKDAELNTNPERWLSLEGRTNARKLIG